MVNVKGVLLIFFDIIMCVVLLVLMLICRMCLSICCSCANFKYLRVVKFVVKKKFITQLGALD